MFTNQEAWRQLQSEVYAQKIIVSQIVDAVAQLSGNRDTFLRNLHSAAINMTEKLEFFNTTEKEAESLREKITERAESLLAAIGGWHK